MEQEVSKLITTQLSLADKVGTYHSTLQNTINLDFYSLSLAQVLQMDILSLLLSIFALILPLHVQVAQLSFNPLLLLVYTNC